MPNTRILIIDDEKNILSSLGRVFQLEGYETDVAESGEAGLEKLARSLPDLLLLDVKLPGIDGLEVLRRVAALHPDMPVIMMSGHGTIDTAVAATKLGARDFIEKPLSSEKLLLTVSNHLKLDSLVRENLVLRREVEEQYRIIGDSPVMRDLLRRIETTAPTNGRVLILGEHGTGKELVARAIHRLSRRYNRPFIKVNCAAIPSELIESELFGHEKGAFTGAIRQRKGKFELAHTGTIFLDEIADMELQMQAKLLRVLQEGEIERVGGSEAIKVDVRVIAATNRNLTEAITTGHFREDLFYRLNVVPFLVPPLRERLGDLPRLAGHFIEIACSENNRRPKSLDAAALDALSRYSWPGNVRELKNIIERLVILGPEDAIGRPDVTEVLPVSLAPAPDGGAEGVEEGAHSLRQRVAAAERDIILRCLKENQWHIRKASERLRIERSHLYKKMRQYGITRESHDGEADA